MVPPHFTHFLPYPLMRPVTHLLCYLLFTGLLLPLRPAWAQVAPPASAVLHGYDFLTVTEFEGYTKNRARILITPAFQGKTEVQLDDLNGSSLSVNKDLEVIQRNTLVLNQQLSELTAAGWELVDVHVVTTLSTTNNTTRYLFRKAKS